MKAMSFGLTGLLLRGPPTVAAQTDHTFQDPNLPVEQRITSIPSLMTLDEKTEALGTSSAVPTHGINSHRFADAIPMAIHHVLTVFEVSQVLVVRRAKNHDIGLTVVAAPAVGVVMVEL